ncbi:Conserved_hypothetical protein [Hexamita inflata]|uniref:Uncharacterized protein n=1 Tax=Hexamita inflata TaxID=28002 RepID=A0AA86PZL0_9EUKA|nr:Conserved hypothetical protein [Hexamita inflata]CAI9942799.1 Conserved hypothetical protein [Hexamita inflata]
MTIESATLITPVLPPVPLTPKKKNGLQNYFGGHFSAVRLQVHQVFGFGTVFICYLICYLIFPTKNDYSILHNTFSHLGSYTKNKNPHGWIFFSFGQIISFFVEIPVVSYIRHRLEPVNKVFARIITGTMYFGTTCQLLIGFFPCTRTIMFGKVMVGAVHQVCATLCFAVQIIGFYLLAIFISIDRCKKRKLNYIRVMLPLLVLLITITLGIAVLVAFHFIYNQRKKNNPQIGSNWSESIDTFWSFTLWENLIIYAMYLYYIWFPFTLPLCPFSASAKRYSTM